MLTYASNSFPEALVFVQAGEFDCAVNSVTTTLPSEAPTVGFDTPHFIESDASEDASGKLPPDDVVVVAVVVAVVDVDELDPARRFRILRTMSAATTIQQHMAIPHIMSIRTAIITVPKYNFMVRAVWFEPPVSQLQ